MDKKNPIAILGVPFDNVTLGEAVLEIERMVGSRAPHYLVTANVDFLAQAQSDGELRRILANADLALCDGTPLVWASRLLGNPLPERVAGADLAPALLKEAARKGWRVYFLGATEESATEAVARLRRELPALKIAGHYSPPFRQLNEAENAEMTGRIREAGADIVFVAFGCPKAEKWIARNYGKVGAAVMVGVGATIDFLAGRVKRAPRWMQRAGLEWVFRLAQEPRRLWRRYTRDLWVFGWGILAQWALLPRRAGARLEAVLRNGTAGEALDLSSIARIDSAGVGRLLKLQKQMRAEGRELALKGANPRVLRALAVMGLEGDFTMASEAGGRVEHAA